MLRGGGEREIDRWWVNGTDKSLHGWILEWGKCMVGFGGLACAWWVGVIPAVWIDRYWISLHFTPSCLYYEERL